jgi:adenosylmethionine-8-amino-7-oxononanoate aminotransferase
MPQGKALSVFWNQFEGVKMSNAFWHGMADMNAISTNGPLVMTKGEGSWVWDDKGKKYFDAAGALWYMNVGHGRKEIGEAMAAQAADIASYSSFGECTTAPTIELADLVASISPVPDSKIFFTSGGSDSIDTALKMSRRFWTLQGKPSKKVIVFRENGYHGMHAGGTSIAGIPPNNDGYSELVEDVVRVPWDDADEMIATIDRIGEENIAAFFCEPIQGAGGVRIPPDLYLQTVRKACAERNILFVADEVISGFGRCGDWFASTRYGLQPDLMTVAKGLTSGYAPMGAVIAAPSVWETFYAPSAGVWRHGYTYGGHATAAAAGIANIKIMMRENLPAHVAQLEDKFASALRTLEDLDVVSEVRTGVGFLGGIQMADPNIAPAMYGKCRDVGVISRAIWGGTLQVAPPLSTTEAEIDEMVELFRVGLTS